LHGIYVSPFITVAGKIQVKGAGCRSVTSYRTARKTEIARNAGSQCNQVANETPVEGMHRFQRWLTGSWEESHATGKAKQERKPVRQKESPDSGPAGSDTLFYFPGGWCGLTQSRRRHRFHISSKDIFCTFINKSLYSSIKTNKNPGSAFGTLNESRYPRHGPSFLLLFALASKKKEVRKRIGL
jgi:hypothetical protein